MPLSDNPLPLPESALILGVSNADQLRQAGTEYLAITNELIKVFNNFAPPTMKLGVIPAPESASINGGQLYFYPIPPVPDLDDSYLPCAGLSSQVLTLGVSRGHAERLLATKSPSVGLLKSDQPLASATWVNWAGLVDFAGPWAEHIIKKPGGFPQPPGVVSKQIQTAREVMEFLKVFRSYSSVTYFEDVAGGKAEVMHAEFVFQDMAAQ